jgi:hypothetical protein
MGYMLKWDNLRRFYFYVMTEGVKQVIYLGKTMIDVGKTGEASEKRDYVRSLIAYLIIYKTLQHLNNIISSQQ